jgi:FixJ family two-component response regulator
MWCGACPTSSKELTEREVLELMADGRSNRAIAERLVISEYTAGKPHLLQLDLGESPDDQPPRSSGGYVSRQRVSADSTVRSSQRA